MIFSSAATHSIAPKGHTDIRFPASAPAEKPSELLFALATSHGYHELQTDDILVVDIGQMTMASIAYQRDLDSKWTAKLIYLNLSLKEAILRVFRWPMNRTRKQKRSER